MPVTFATFAVGLGSLPRPLVSKPVTSMGNGL